MTGSILLIAGLCPIANAEEPVSNAAIQSAIKKGARVVTTSGIHGKVVDLNNTDNTCTIETGAGKIKFERSAISMELSKKYSKEAVKK